MQRAVFAIAIMVIDVAPALATEPCFDVCHLRQGQPLLLPAEHAILVRRCESRKGTETCFVERLNLEGRLVTRLPSSDVDDERAFDAKYLRGKSVVRLNWGNPWADLTKPYGVSLPSSNMTLRLEQEVLVCERTTGVVKRSLGCRPTALSVRTAGVGQDGKPEDPSGVTLVIAACAAREVIAVCNPKP